MKNKVAFWIITILSLLLVLFVLGNIIIHPVLTKSPLPKAVIRTPVEKGKTDKADNKNQKEETIAEPEMANGSKDAHNNLFELRKKEFLLQSRYTLANDDSMYLVLDLVKNLAILEIKGISLHECPLLEVHISNSIKMYHTEALLNWMAEPFQAKRIDATIPKISFIEKIAPKDTLEANRMVAEPVMPKLGDVYIVMDFDRNLRLVISQSELPDEEGKKVISALRKKYNKIEIARSVNSLTKFNREPVKPQIEIVIPKSDATILYKALPLNPGMILRM